MDIETFVNFVDLAWEYVGKDITDGIPLNIKLYNVMNTEYSRYKDGLGIRYIKDSRSVINNFLDDNQKNFEDLFRMFLAMCADLKLNCGGIGDCDHCISGLDNGKCIKNICSMRIPKNYAVYCGDVKLTSNMNKRDAQAVASELQNVEVRKVN